MKIDLEKIYRNKTVLITGHTGFKGSWLSFYLNKLGAKVIGYGLDPICKDNIFELTDLKNKVVDIRKDIRDYKRLKEVIDDYKIDCIFHLAAQALVKESYINPRETYEINVLGSANLLEAFRLNAYTKAAVIITSDKCYENKEWLWGYRENDRLGGLDPYSSSKGCAEILVSSYLRSFFSKDKLNSGKALASARAGNVIGGGDWSPDRLIPDSIRSLLNNSIINLRMPQAIRPWQHVLDPIYGYILLGAKLMTNGVEFSGSYNFGPRLESTITTEELVNKLLRYWGSGSYSKELPNEVFHEAGLLRLDITKAKELLGWVSNWDVDKAIKNTVEWYKNINTESCEDIVNSQIDDFTETIV
ncbi:MAG TPA: CDP-glucose 4,6-dehydratase [Clostridiaceae bacterium]